MSDRIVGDVLDQLTAFRAENITLKAERDELLALVRHIVTEVFPDSCRCGGCFTCEGRALLSRLDGPVTP